MKCQPEDHHREYIQDRIVSLNANEYLWKCTKCGTYGEDIVGSSIIAPDTQEAREILKYSKKERLKHK